MNKEKIHRMSDEELNAEKIKGNRSLFQGANMDLILEELDRRQKSKKDAEHDEIVRMAADANKITKEANDIAKKANTLSKWAICVSLFALAASVYAVFSE
jgi:hypothetical protein